MRISDTDRRSRSTEIALYQVGQAMAAGNLVEARRYWSKASALEGDNPSVLSLGALLLEREGQAESAGALHQQALTASPGSIGLINNYGAWLCGRGLPEEALVVFDRGLDMPEGRLDAGLLANAGSCARRSGQMVRSEHDLRSAIAVEPDNAQALFELALIAASRQDWMTARAFYQRRMMAAPMQVSVLKLAIDVERGLGDEVAAGKYQNILLKSMAKGDAVTQGMGDSEY